MSQPPNNKGKDISGKKYASLNVNQTYKGTKVENRSAAAQTRHGMQSLGKIGQNRRLPPPANLPSLKKENLGNDPTVNLVPTGSSGWGKKEKPTTKTEEQTQVSHQKPLKQEQAPEISLRPNAGVGHKNQSEQGKGWSNLQTSTGSVPQPPANSFQREFPRLGGGAAGQSTQESVREPDLDERGTASDTNIQPRPNEEKWMMGPGQMAMGGPGVRVPGPRMDFNFSRDQQRPMFNGAPMQPPPAGSQFFPPFAPGMVHPYMHMMPLPYPYNRMPPPGTMNQPTRPTTTKTDSAERPATVKQEDIQGMDDDVDDGGWAGAQEEVDYTAKLNFDESDEEPELPKKPDSKAKTSDKNKGTVSDEKHQPNKESSEKRNAEGRPEGWEDQSQGFQGQMQFRQQPWMRPPFPTNFDPSRGPPPSQNYAFPPPWMYTMPNAYRMPGMPPQRNSEGGQPPVSHQPSQPSQPGGDSSSSTGDRASAKDSGKSRSQSQDWRKKDNEMDRIEEERRAKATAKLHELEAKMKQREEERRRDSESSNKSGRRERIDSDNSDSSRGGTQRAYGDKYAKPTRETPPRFKKQNSLAKPGKSIKTDGTTPTSTADATDAGSAPRIMRRRDSLKSDDASSVHSQDSWANVPNSEQVDHNYDASEEGLWGKKPQTSEHARRSSENAGYFEKRQGREKAPQDREKQDYQREIVRDVHHKRTRESDRKSTAKGDEITESNMDSGQALRLSKSQQDDSREESRTESKKDVKRYDYRQEKVKLKEARSDNRQTRKEQEFEMANRLIQDDKKYRGKEPSSRWKDDSKSEAKKDGKQEEPVKRFSSEESADRKSEFDKRSGGSSATFLRKNQEDKVPESQQILSKEEREIPSKPRPENFKRLEKSKPKNMAVKLSNQSKDEAKDKHKEKVQQTKEQDSKRPSAWAKVVTGEANDSVGDSKGAPQPSKTLREIQAEEEIRENEINKNQEKEQERLQREEKAREERSTYGQDARRQPRDMRDRRPEDRNQRRDNYYGRRDDQSDYRNEYGRDYRRDDGSGDFQRRKPEYNNEKKAYNDYRAKERFEHPDRDEVARYENKNNSRQNTYEDRRRNYDDRKRKHEDTVKPEERRRKTRDSDEEASEERNTFHDRKGFGQDYSDRPADRRYAERGRGARGRGSSSRSRGRGAYSSRSSYSRDGSYGPKATQRVSVESLSDKSQGSHSPEVNDESSNEVGKIQTKDDDVRVEKRDSRKAKELKEVGRREIDGEDRRDYKEATRKNFKEADEEENRETIRNEVKEKDNKDFRDIDKKEPKEKDRKERKERERREPRESDRKFAELKDFKEAVRKPSGRKDYSETERKDFRETERKDFREAERKDFGEAERKDDEQLNKKSEDRRRGSARSREDQSYYDNRDYRSRYEKKDSTRGRGRSRGRGHNNSSATRSSGRPETSYERSESTEHARVDKNAASDGKKDEQNGEGKKNVKNASNEEDHGNVFADDEDYIDYESDSAERKHSGHDKESKERYDASKDQDSRTQSRTRGRGQLSARGYRERPQEDRRYDSSLKAQRVPPRFQRQIDTRVDHQRGRGVRGTRSRGKTYPGYGARGRGFGKPPTSREHKSSNSHADEGKDEGLSGDSDDDTFHSADGSIHSGDEETTNKEYRQHKEYDSSKRYSSRGRSNSSRGTRGRGRGARGGNTHHFLADRQQDRVSHIDSSEWAGTLPAAGKIVFAGSKSAEDKPGAKAGNEGKRGSTVKRQTDGRSAGHSGEANEALSEFSEPPKKMAKSRVTEKRDLRQLYVNNFASVVCIDDMPGNKEDVSQTENDGFVQVTSRKAQKFLREQQKEEEKRKQQEELNMKSAKKTSSEVKDTVSKPGKPTKFTDHQSQRVPQSYPQTSGQVTMTDVSQSQASNAAMAAVGGWEPAQALLRGVQSVATTDSVEVSKSTTIPAPPPTMNAWKRPLSFASSLAGTTTTTSYTAPHSVPDPKAVGTGKPNSSPAKQLPIMQTSQSGDGIHAAAPVYSEASISEESKQQPTSTDDVDAGGDSRQSTQKQAPTRKTEQQRKVNKGTKRETAPRFQNISKSKTILNGSMPNGDVNVTRSKKKTSATAEDVATLELSKLQGEDRAPGNRTDRSTLRRCNSESSKEEPVTGLPVLKHGEQPVISFIQDEVPASTDVTDTGVKEPIHSEPIMTERLEKPELQGPSEEEENAKDTAASVIKSLGDEDEKNLETRSLPSSTPPLVVDIHAPRSNGPSSDPGKGPAIPVPHTLTQEVNEMSMKVLSAKKIWDNVPSQVAEALSVVTSSQNRKAWSEEENANTAAISAPSIVASSAETVSRESTQVKEHIVSQTPVAVVAAQGLDSTENDTTSEVTSSSAFIAKKTVIESQNNVCKVKPQQKQSQQSVIDDKQHLITSFSNGQLFQSQFPFQQSYALPVQSSTSHSKLQQHPYVLSDSATSTALFPQRETAQRDLPSQHSQPQMPANMQQMNQARPTSPLSHQHQDILQPSMMLSNIYGAPSMQGTQQSPVLWPVISRHAMASSSSYLSQQQSHERHSDIGNPSSSYPSTPIYMTFDQGSSPILSAPRLNSQMHQTPALGLVLPQQNIRSGSMLSVIRTNQASKESPMFGMSLSPGPFHQNTDLQLSGPNQSDLTKHVNAKPFQPSSRTPPSAQSSQMMSSQSQLMGQFNKLIGPSQQQQQSNQQMTEHHHSAIAEKQHNIQAHALQTHSLQQQQSHVLAVQPHGSMQHSSQPAQHQVQSMTLQQHASQQQTHGQQHFMQHHSFPSSHVAPVGPRPLQSRTASAASPTLQSQNRLGTLSPVDPNLQFVHGTSSSVKGVSQSHQHGHLVQPGSHSGGLVQVLQQGQNLPSHGQQARPFIVRPSQSFASFQQALPGPIKRPPKQTAANQALPTSRPKQPVLPMVKGNEPSQSLAPGSHISSGGQAPSGHAPSTTHAATVGHTSSGILAPSSAHAAPGTLAPASSFRSEEHQKMIEETRKYFALQNKSEPTPKPIVIAASSSSSPCSSVAANVPVAPNASIAPGGAIAPSVSIGNNNSAITASTPIANSATVLRSTPIAPAQVILARPLEKKVKEETPKPKAHEESSDIPTAAMLNDPNDIDSIIKSRPSLAKALKNPPSKPEKSNRQGGKKTVQKKSEDKADKNKRSENLSSSKSSSKADQKMGVAAPITQRNDRFKATQKVRGEGKSGKH